MKSDGEYSDLALRLRPAATRNTLATDRPSERRNSPDFQSVRAQLQNSSQQSGLISEQRAYAQSIRSQLADRHPELLAELRSRLPQISQSIRKNHSQGKLEFKTVDRAMREFVREGKLSESEYERTRAEALATADTDHQLGLSTDAGSFNPEAKEISENGAHLATTEQIAAFLLAERLNPTRRDRVKPAEVREDQTVGGIDGTTAPVPVGDSTPITPAPSTPGLPQADSKKTEFTGFLWKPHSDSDGRLVILLPASITGAASKVEILNPAGTRVIANGSYAGIGNGFRQHYRFEQSGEHFPANAIVKITLSDGQVGTVRIPNPGQRWE